MKFLAQTSGHLRKYLPQSPALQKQFLYSTEEEIDYPDCFLDPLGEDAHEKVKGLINSYGNRALILLTLTCAAYCRFCTRKRRVSDIAKGRIGEKELLMMKKYLLATPQVKELIFSGGDPLTAPQTLTEALEILGKLDQIKIIRIGTRVPVSQPSLITDNLLTVLKKLDKIFYLMIHFEHPDELTPETLEAVKKLRKTGAMLFSQSVFLKGVNDNVEVLYELFSRLVEIGVKPYYIYRCDPVIGTGHFRVPLEKEIAIMTELRTRLSGLAYPIYVIDTPNGSGKIPVPLNFWKFAKDSYQDFLGEKHKVI